MPVRVTFEQDPHQTKRELADVNPGEERGLGNMQVTGDGRKSRSGHMIVAACDPKDTFGTIHYTNDQGDPDQKILTSTSPSFKARVSNCIEADHDSGYLLLRFYRHDQTDSEALEDTIPPDTLMAEASVPIPSG